jgi:hypothetical protein
LSDHGMMIGTSMDTTARVQLRLMLMRKNAYAIKNRCGN